MSEVTLQINNRGYGLACDDGQEGRVLELGRYVDSRLKDIAASGAANGEAHLLVLTSLVLADEVYDLRDQVAQMQEKMHFLQGKLDHLHRNPQYVQQSLLEEEQMVAQAIDHLADKIDYIAGRIQKAA